MRASRTWHTRLVAAAVFVLVTLPAGAGEASAAGATTPYPLPECTAARDTDCIAHVFPSYAEALALRGSQPPPCYLELWDAALWSAVDAYPDSHPCQIGRASCRERV